MEQWVIGATAMAIVTVLAAGTAQAIKFNRSLQKTIDKLRDRIDKMSDDIQTCLEDRAALRQKIEDLEKLNG